MTRKNNRPRRVLLDINVLFGDFLHRYPQYGSRKASPPKHEVRNRLFASEAVTYLRKRPGIKTFVADFSVAKVISLMEQTSVPKKLQIEEIERLITRHSVVALGSSLIAATLEEFKSDPLVKDMEDSLQFALSRKHDCSHIITFNKKDFLPFDVSVILPGDIRTLV
jgi:predicted nucleic acid-binding protein